MATENVATGVPVPGMYISSGSLVEAFKNNIGQYGRFDGAAKYIDPREE